MADRPYPSSLGVEAIVALGYRETNAASVLFRDAVSLPELLIFDQQLRDEPLQTHIFRCKLGRLVRTALSKSEDGKGLQRKLLMA